MNCDVAPGAKYFSPAPRSHGQGFGLFYDAAKINTLPFPVWALDPEALKFLDTLWNSNGRAFAVTESFDMAMVPPLSKPGDESFVIKGLRDPV